MAESAAVPRRSYAYWESRSGSLVAKDLPAPPPPLASFSHLKTLTARSLFRTSRGPYRHRTPPPPPSPGSASRLPRSASRVRAKSQPPSAPSLPPRGPRGAATLIKCGWCAFAQIQSPPPPRYPPPGTRPQAPASPDAMSKALLGSRISLVSLKDIRYEGILYSINEQDATVALQDVRSFGTEGREKAEAGGSGAFVPAADAVHPYLLFRGCDIKDLHVHEGQGKEEEKEERPAPPEDPAIVSTEVPEAVQRQQQARADREAKRPEAGDRARRSARGGRARSGGGGGGCGGGGGGGNGEREGQPSERKPRAAVGTGADLLGRKARGTVDGAGKSFPPMALMHGTHRPENALPFFMYSCFAPSSSPHLAFLLLRLQVPRSPTPSSTSRPAWTSSTSRTAALPTTTAATTMTTAAGATPRTASSTPSLRTCRTARPGRTSASAAPPSASSTPRRSAPPAWGAGTAAGAGGATAGGEGGAAAAAKAREADADGEENAAAGGAADTASRRRTPGGTRERGPSLSSRNAIGGLAIGHWCLLWRRGGYML